HPGPLPDGERERLADLAERAAYLAKADLVTGMVGEFPELQGLMGGYYAAAHGEDPRVAEAVRDHYKPVGQGDDVPTAPVTVAVALADKLDTLVAFFAVGEQPTGSKDPFAIRRAALAILRLIQVNDLRMQMARVMATSAKPVIDRILDEPYRSACNAEELIRHGFVSKTPYVADPTSITGPGAYIRTNVLLGLPALAGFFADRLKVQQREAGVRHDLIDAVFALGGEDDLVRLLARVHALQAFVTTDDGTNLLAGYKRAANILKKEGVEGDQSWTEPTYTPEPAEADLIAALDAAEPKAAQAVKAEDFEAAMA
ncbi:glycyl-tRNA synthetase subunit beta, partial [Sphingomonas yabuuchiae]